MKPGYISRTHVHGHTLIVMADRCMLAKKSNYEDIHFILGFCFAKAMLAITAIVFLLFVLFHKGG